MIFWILPFIIQKSLNLINPNSDTSFINLKFVFYDPFEIAKI